MASRGVALFRWLWNQKTDGLRANNPNCPTISSKRITDVVSPVLFEANEHGELMSLHPGETPTPGDEKDGLTFASTSKWETQTLSRWNGKKPVRRADVLGGTGTPREGCFQNSPGVNTTFCMCTSRGNESRN